MSSEEQKQILKMVEDGRISAEEAMELIKALEESDVEMEIIEAAPASSSGPFDAAQDRPETDSDTEKPNAPEFEEVARDYSPRLKAGASRAMPRDSSPSLKILLDAFSSRSMTRPHTGH